MTTTTHIQYPLAAGSASGYLALPDGAGPFPAVLVIQEWWGLDSHIMSLCERLTEAGFLALAPDLYHGAVASEPDAARKLAMDLALPAAVAEMVAAINYLCGRADVRAIGAVGFCMGGGLALALSGATPRVGPVVAFYGARSLTPQQARQIGGPVLAIFGGRDDSIPAEQRAALEAVLAEQGVPHEIVVYPDSQHAFMNDTRPASYDPAAAADAWRRMIEFLQHGMEPR